MEVDGEEREEGDGEVEGRRRGGGREGDEEGKEEDWCFDKMSLL